MVAVCHVSDLTRFLWIVICSTVQSTIGKIALNIKHFLKKCISDSRGLSYN